jgi:hypothetical protein
VRRSFLFCKLICIRNDLRANYNAKLSAANTGLPSGAGHVTFEPLFSRKQEKTMKKLGRSFAAALLLFAMTAVTFADGQIDVPLTTPTPSATYQAQTDTPSATDSSAAVTSQTDTTDTTATEAGLVLFQAFSSVL